MPRRYVPPRTGWASHMPNATSIQRQRPVDGTRSVALGAGLEPAHALRREPRLRRGAIPFRSSYRLNDLAETIRFERMVPIEHSALAARCLRPLGHISVKYWWGWRDLNSHVPRHWFLRPACLPFPPHPHSFVTRNNLLTLPTFRLRAPNLSTSMVGFQGLEP